MPGWRWLGEARPGVLSRRTRAVTIHGAMETAGDGSPGGVQLPAFLSGAREKAAAGSPVEISVRQLLRYFGAERRGVRVIGQIEHALDEHGLTTQPPFTAVWIDHVVQLPLAAVTSSEQDGAAKSVPDDADSLMPASLTVSSLESASSEVASIQRNSSLERARSLLLRYDYSQLAVMSGERKLFGAISWQSMAIAALCKTDFTLADATVKAEAVDPDRDLISLIPTIVERGYVFVVAPDGRLAGVRTTADLTTSSRPLRSHSSSSARSSDSCGES